MSKSARTVPPKGAQPRPALLAALRADRTLLGLLAALYIALSTFSGLAQATQTTLALNHSAPAWDSVATVLCSEDVERDPKAAHHIHCDQCCLQVPIAILPTDFAAIGLTALQLTSGRMGAESSLQTDTFIRLSARGPPQA